MNPVMAQFESALKGHGFSRAVSIAFSFAASQFAEKLAVSLDFGWRSASALR
jgi:hypothetical protein